MLNQMHLYKLCIFENADFQKLQIWRQGPVSNRPRIFANNLSVISNQTSGSSHSRSTVFPPKFSTMFWLKPKENWSSTLNHRCIGTFSNKRGCKITSILTSFFLAMKLLSFWIHSTNYFVLFVFLSISKLRGKRKSNIFFQKFFNQVIKNREITKEYNPCQIINKLVSKLRTAKLLY